MTAWTDGLNASHGYTDTTTEPTAQPASFTWTTSCSTPPKPDKEELAAEDASELLWLITKKHGDVPTEEDAKLCRSAARIIYGLPLEEEPYVE